MPSRLVTDALYWTVCSNAQHWMFRFCDKNSKIFLISPQKTFKKQQKLPKNSSFASQSRNFFCHYSAWQRAPLGAASSQAGVERQRNPCAMKTNPSKPRQGRQKTRQSSPPPNSSKPIKAHQIFFDGLWRILMSLVVNDFPSKPPKLIKAHQFFFDVL